MRRYILAGLIAAFAGIVGGSLAPQFVVNRHDAGHHIKGLNA